jgi:hypothetical protein
MSRAAKGRPKQAAVPAGERRWTSSSRLLGNCPPERLPVCKPARRPRYSADEGHQ